MIEKSMIDVCSIEIYFKILDFIHKSNTYISYETKRNFKSYFKNLNFKI